RGGAGAHARARFRVGGRGRRGAPAHGGGPLLGLRGQGRRRVPPHDRALRPAPSVRRGLLRRREPGGPAAGCRRCRPRTHRVSIMTMSKVRVGRWTAALRMIAASLRAVLGAPVEAQMGVVQKIVYLHVPSATATLLAFALTFAASIAYLATRAGIWDAVAASA